MRLNNSSSTSCSFFLSLFAVDGGWKMGTKCHAHKSYFLSFFCVLVHNIHNNWTESNRVKDENESGNAFIWKKTFTLSCLVPLLLFACLNNSHLQPCSCLFFLFYSTMKTHPGSVVHLSDNPLDSNKVSIRVAKYVQFWGM